MSISIQIYNSGHLCRNVNGIEKQKNCNQEKNHGDIKGEKYKIKALNPNKALLPMHPLGILIIFLLEPQNY